MALTRDEIISAIAERKAKVESFEVAEWGGEVFIRRLDAADLEATGLLDGGGNTAQMAIQLMVTCLADENGVALFTQKDVETLSGTDFPVVLKVFSEVAKVNGLSSEGLDEAMAAFAAAQPDASSSS